MGENIAKIYMGVLTFILDEESTQRSDWRSHILRSFKEKAKN